MPPDSPAAADSVERSRFNSREVKGPYIALTFDDGPHAELSPRLLEMLAARELRATFFVIGREVSANRDLLVREFAAGHEIANHTWTHPHLTRLGPDEQIDELARTSELIAELTGTSPALMRPPYLDTNAALEQSIHRRFGLKVIGASVYSEDTTPGITGAEIVRNVCPLVEPGSIVLCHDNRPTTIDVIPEVLDTLLGRGFQFVTVSELLAMT